MNFLRCPECGELYPVDLEGELTLECENWLEDHLVHIDEDEHLEVICAEGNA